MFEITKEFAFSAAHHLPSLPPEHPCSRRHGHNYRVRVELRGRWLDEHGMLLDYGALAPFGRWVDEHLDHRDLNEVIEDGDPTAERLAHSLRRVLLDLIDLPAHITAAVGVSETPKTWAWVR